MKARILPIDTDEHARVQTLLPWFINGTLGGAETLRVGAHVSTCARCQADCALQKRLCELVELPDDQALSDEAASDADRDWAALRSRLDVNAEASREPDHAPDRASVHARDRAPRGQPAPTRSTRWRWSRWQQLVLGAQGALVLVLAAALLMVTRQSEPYRALAAAPTVTTANALVVFRPQATEAQIRAALRASDARLVGGPTVTDAYLLRMPALDAQTLARFRADPAVLRVESLEAEGAAR